MNVKPTPQIEDNSMNGTIVTENLPRHGSPQDRGSADAYYGRRYDPHYYVGASLQSERVGKDNMTVGEIEAYRYGYDNEEDRKDW